MEDKNIMLGCSNMDGFVDPNQHQLEISQKYYTVNSGDFLDERTIKLLALDKCVRIDIYQNKEYKSHIVLMYEDVLKIKDFLNLETQAIQEIKD